MKLFNLLHLTPVHKDLSPSTFYIEKKYPSLKLKTSIIVDDIIRGVTYFVVFMDLANHEICHLFYDGFVNLRIFPQINKSWYLRI